MAPKAIEGSTQAPSVLRKSTYGSGRIARSIFALTAASAPSQLGLYQELALAKTALADTAKVYECMTSDVMLAIESGKAEPELLRQAYSMLSLIQPRLQSGLDTVRSIAKTASDIEMAIAIQPDMLAFLASSIERIITTNVRDDRTRENLEHELLTAFAETTIRSHQSTEAILSPHDTVYQIDQSVPDVPCDEADYANRLKKTEESEEPLPEWETYSDLELSQDQEDD